MFEQRNQKVRNLTPRLRVVIALDGNSQSASSLAFVQSDHENLHLVNTVYLTLQKSSIELKQRVKQSVVTKSLCDQPDRDLKSCA